MSIKWKSKKRPHSILGLTLSEGGLQAFHMVRAKGGVEVVKAASAVLSLDLLHPEAELVGREIKNHLDEAGISESHCIVAIPPRWVMSQHTKVPELSAEDATSFLQIEAEKGFPVDPAQLQIARSFHRSADTAYVTQLAVRHEQVTQLSAVLKAAGLKPVSYSLGLAVLPGVSVPAGQGRVTLSVEPSGVTLLIWAGGGIAAYRTCEGSIDSEAGEKLVNVAAVARELRITFEQVPADLRAEIRQLFLTGESAMARQLAESLGDWAKAAGLGIIRGDLPEKNVGAEMAQALATRWLETGAVDLEFLPPRPSRWALLMARYNSKRLATTGFAVAGVVVLTMMVFGWQEYRRWSLQSEWAGMQAQVSDLDAVQANTREFRPWYDTSFRSLTILKRVTECFPDNGSVTAKTIELHGNPIVNVSVSGTARDVGSLLKTLDQLRNKKEVQGLKTEQIRGKTPAQFTFTFRWIPLSSP